MNLLPSVRANIQPRNIFFFEVVIGMVKDLIHVADVGSGEASSIKENSYFIWGIFEARRGIL